jgi:hypothetical protein
VVEKRRQNSSKARNLAESSTGRGVSTLVENFQA